MAVYDIRLSSSYKKYPFTKMEYFEVVSIKKSFITHRNTNSKQYGLTLGTFKFCNA